MALRLIVLVAAVLAIICVLLVGRRNSSGVLVALFVLWVFAPFGALGMLVKASNHWDDRKRRLLRGLTIVVCAAAVCIYGFVANGISTSKPAFWFLVLPAASLVAIATTYLTALRK